MTFWVLLRPWLEEHWFPLVQSAGIIAGLLFAARQALAEARSRRISNLIQLTQFQREIWRLLLDHPELKRVLDRSIQPARSDISLSEELFVQLLILHINMAYRAKVAEAPSSIEVLRNDVGSLMSLPIPKLIWADYRPFHDQDFVAFVEQAVEVERQRSFTNFLRRKHSLPVGTGSTDSTSSLQLAEELAHELLSLTRNLGIELTEPGENLIRLSAYAWFTDLHLRKGYPSDYPHHLARKIVELATKERHVLDAQQRAGRVDFFSWFYALGRSGRKFLQAIYEKRF